jgi:hypothetical protein
MTHENDTNANDDPMWNDGDEQIWDKADPTWPLVVVQWRDAHQGGDGNSWTATDDYEPETVMPITVGWIWPKVKEGYLTICSTVMNSADDPDTVGDVNHIPWENVVTMYSLTIHLPVNWHQEGIQ